jgi:4-amino-4-deoxy-L-arabinose transferase-like glycosyltransferase
MQDLRKKDKKLILVIIGIFLVALLPRLAVAINSRLIPINDAAGYDTYALNLLAGKGFVNPEGQLTSWREPVYPTFLSCIYYLFGHSFLAVRIIQAVLGALVCVIIFLTCRRLLGSGIAIISALLCCINLSLIEITEHLFTENLFIFLFALGIFLLLLARENDLGFRNLIAAGFVLGLATLTRSVTILFPLFILIFMAADLIFKPIPRNRLIKIAIVFLLAFSFTIFPWTLRNWRVHKKLVPVVTRTGLGLYSSFVPPDGKTFGFNANDAVTRKAETLNSEVERSDYLTQETFKYIKNNPRRVVKLELIKLLFFWAPFDWSIFAGEVYNFSYGFVLPFFIFGIFITFRRFKDLALIYLPVIYILFCALVTFGIPRFRLPVEPYIIIIAAAGIERFWQMFSKKILPILILTCFYLMNLGMYFNSYQTKIFLKSLLSRLNIW